MGKSHRKKIVRGQNKARKKTNKNSDKNVTSCFPEQCPPCNELMAAERGSGLTEENPGREFSELCPAEHIELSSKESEFEVKCKG